MMRADLLHVVAVIANPIRWRSRIALFRAFEQHMLQSGVHLLVVECQYGERPFECAGTAGVTHVGVRATTLVWNKECLINLGIARLPAEAKYIAWIDADVRFRKAGWAAEAVQALQIYPVVQPWSDCYDLGPNDDHLQAHKSFARLYFDGAPIQPTGRPGYAFAHPGYAWAATRDALERVGGLLDVAALGAGDHHMALGLIGRAEESLPGGVHPHYRAAVLQWQGRAERHLARHLGYVPGTIEHAWHGSKDKRAYVSRWDILTQYDFNPLSDLKRNTFGVIELAGNKPAFAHAIDRYMRDRDEDSNSL